MLRAVEMSYFNFTKESSHPSDHTQCVFLVVSDVTGTRVQKRLGMNLLQYWMKSMKRLSESVVGDGQSLMMLNFAGSQERPSFETICPK